MQGISTAARTIVWTSDDAWRRIDAWLDKRSSRSVMPDRVVTVGVVVREGETTIDGHADVTDGSLILRVRGRGRGDRYADRDEHSRPAAQRSNRSGGSVDS